MNNPTVIFTATAGQLGVITGFLLGVLFQGILARLRYFLLSARIALQARATVAHARMEFARRKKSPILAIGDVERTVEGETPVNFVFDVAAAEEIPLTAVGPDGEAVLSGWTHAELLHLAKAKQYVEEAE
ncbi:MAG TPA: hypothetical protein VFE31_08845 [Opitutaceae bacterium]|nr:hypothetical protein [Opitutaceae bacterium]